MQRRLKHNVDRNEIRKFNAMTEDWWDPNGRLRALHDINGLRVDYIDRRSRLAGKPVLDIGCGGGILSEAMARRGARVTGIDASATAVAVARRHAEQREVPVDYRRTTAESLSRGSRSAFKVITCMELLEHVPEPASVVAACSRLVQSGGDVFFATINRNLKAWLMAIVGAEYVLGLVPRGTHRYRNLIMPEELERWCTSAGLRRDDATGLHYNPFTRTYRLGGHLHVNYMTHYRKSRYPG
jgi:2-polyprenyl-6-hydroxyphenyl methylase/3-demethylubiquinone-9 3-methyltransferase